MSRCSDDALREAFRKALADVGGDASAAPYPYQLLVGQHILAGRNVLLRAPTGAGKTLAAMVPFLVARRAGRLRRLIYALPLRTLAQAIYAEAQRIVQSLCPGEPVTLQTGEAPGDPFLDTGTIIVTTYDQVLSGLLGAPYSLSRRQRNINCAAVAGALVVFDEFHLMDVGRAFLSAPAALSLFDGMCQSLWMTATATEPLEQVLRDALRCEPVDLSQSELSSLPSVAGVRRVLVRENRPLEPSVVLRHPDARSIVIFNQVRRAQEFMEALRCEAPDILSMLIHSRFFQSDRREKEQKLREWFGRRGEGPRILVSTQVVEAGLDITSDHLHTELCPMNALVQRAGRCARWSAPDGRIAEGWVHVYPLPDEPGAWLPYDEALVHATDSLLQQIGEAEMEPRALAAWIEAVHAEADRAGASFGWRYQLETCITRLRCSVTGIRDTGVSDLIRDADNVRVVLANQPPPDPLAFEGLRLSRGTLQGLVRTQCERGGAWGWQPADDEGEAQWTPIATAGDAGRYYLVCLSPKVASYDPEYGLRLGLPGTTESPPRSKPEPPGYKPLPLETWRQHAEGVARHAVMRAKRDLAKDAVLLHALQARCELSIEEILKLIETTAALHDMGKLLSDWQGWAHAYQQAKDPTCVPQQFLAHTEYDPHNPHDAAADQAATEAAGRRPPHAAVGAYLSLPWLLSVVPNRHEAALFAMAAVLGHHGGGLQGASLPARLAMCPGWVAEADAATGLRADRGMVKQLLSDRAPSNCLQAMLDAVLGYSFAKWWPIVAYLTRVLRLSDQDATAEGGERE